MNDVDYDNIIDNRLAESLFDDELEERLLAQQISIEINEGRDNNDGDGDGDDYDDDNEYDEGNQATSEDVILVLQTIMNLNNFDNNNIDDNNNNDNNVDNEYIDENYNSDDINNNNNDNDNDNDNSNQYNHDNDNNNENNHDNDNNNDKENNIHKISYPLHWAVFHRDINTVEDIILENKTNLKDYDIQDGMKNTPLMLSIKLGFNEISHLLLQSGFNFNIKSCDNYHLLDEALLASRDYRLIREIYLKMQLNLVKKWTDNVNALLETLIKIPDFCLQLNWKFEANGLLKPLLALLNPSDTYKIYKKGDSLRIDSSISGLKKSFGLNPIQRGSVSILLIGTGTNYSNFNPGELIKIDHDTKKYKRIIDILKNPKESKTHDAVITLMNNTKKKNKADTLSFDIDGISFCVDDSNNSTKKIEKWPTSKWVAEGDITVNTISKSSNVETMMSSSQYFNGTDFDCICDNNGLKKTNLINKKMKAKINLTEELPFKIHDFMPLIDVLSFDEKKFGALIKLLNETKKNEGMKGFPIKIKMALLMGISLTFKVEEFKRDNICEDIYNIGDGYIDDTENSV